MIRSLLTLSLAGLLLQTTVGVSCVGQTEASPKNTYQWKFTAKIHPSGKFWRVVLPVDHEEENDVLIVNVMSDDGPDWPMEKRAEEIARRMNSFEKSDPTWVDDISTGQWHGEDVVKPEKNAEGWVMTADRFSISRWNVRPKTTEQLAIKIMKDMRAAFNNPQVKNALNGKGNINEALKNREKNAKDLFEEGEVYQAQGRPAKAQIDYQQAIRLEKDYVEAYVALAQIYRDQNNLVKAKEQLSAAQANDPSPEQVQRINGLEANINELLKTQNR